MPLAAWSEHVLRTLVTVRDTTGLENAAYYLWVAMGSLWEFIDENLRRVFDDSRFSASPPENHWPSVGLLFILGAFSCIADLSGQVLGVWRQGEMQLDSFLVLIHNFLPNREPLQAHSKNRVVLVLSRMAKYCEQQAALVRRFVSWGRRYFHGLNIASIADVQSQPVSSIHN